MWRGKINALQTKNHIFERKNSMKIYFTAFHKQIRSSIEIALKIDLNCGEKFGFHHCS